MMFRSLLIATALLAAAPTVALAQARDAAPSAPVLRANVTVSSDIVRIGDVVDNAGSAAQIAIYRAPDLGTTGTLPVAQIIATLRTHQVIGVDTKNMNEISVTRQARTVTPSDIEQHVAQALERRNGLGDAADLQLTFDRSLQTMQLESSNNGALHATAARFDPRSGRFDVVLEITNEASSTPTRLRFTGTAVDTVEAVVLARGIDRNEIVKASDVSIERRPRAELGREAAGRDQGVGMQARRQLRAGQALRASDLAKPDLVQRDQAVTIVYQTGGITLTIRGKAMENGTDGDVVSVMNLQTKRSFSGVVVGRGQVLVTPPRAAQTAAVATAPVAVAANDHLPVSRKAE